MGGYGIVPVSILEDKQLTSGHIMVLLALSSFSNKEKECWPSLSKIAMRAHLSRRDVSRKLIGLIESGYIVRTQRKLKGKKECDSTLYQLKIQQNGSDWESPGSDVESLGVVTGSHQVVTVCHGGSDCMAQELIPLNNPIEQSHKKEKKEPSVDALRLAILLGSLHKEKIDPGYKVPPTEKWAYDIDKLNRIEGRPWEDIEAVIRWVKTPGQFWAANIVSGNKLREKFPQLIAKMKLIPYQGARGGDDMTTVNVEKLKSLQRG